jgi:hypothetical protein
MSKTSVTFTCREQSLHRITWRAAGHVSTEFWQSETHYFELVSIGLKRSYFYATAIDGMPMGAQGSREFTSRAGALAAMRLFGRPAPKLVIEQRNYYAAPTEPTKAQVDGVLAFLASEKTVS